MLEATNDFKKTIFHLNQQQTGKLVKFVGRLNYHQKKKLSSLDKRNQKLLNTKINTLFKIKGNIIRCMLSQFI